MSLEVVKAVKMELLFCVVTPGGLTDTEQRLGEKYKSWYILKYVSLHKTSEPDFTRR
jgi:hypothetical protein